MIISGLSTAIWNYRYFIASSIRNDLRTRFARSKLGAAWMILQPLALVLIYSLVLSRIMSSKLPGINGSYSYSIYLLSGMMAWSLFNEIIMRALTVFVDNATMLKKIVFPRVCLPIITLGSGLVNNIFLFIVTIAVFVVLGHVPTIAIVWMPLLIVITAAFSLSIGLLLGILNVFVRDVAQFMNVVLQLLFWLTPVVYTSNIVPPRFHEFLKFNPLYWIVADYQDVLAYGRAPEIKAMMLVVLATILLLVFSLKLFRKAAADMADVL